MKYRLIVSVRAIILMDVCISVMRITEIFMRGKISLKRSPSDIRRHRATALKLIYIELWIAPKKLIDNVIEYREDELFFKFLFRQL